MKSRILLLAWMLLFRSWCFAAAPSTPREFVNSIGMRFIRIEAGTFRMGENREIGEEWIDPLCYPARSELAKRFPEMDPSRFHLPAHYFRSGDYDEHPVHMVSIRDPFYMGAFEVTNAQYERFDPSHRSLRGKMGFSHKDDEAVIFVSWQDAIRFCQWLSRKEKRPYRLPTEAEWEYAARAGSDTLFFTGNTLPPAYRKNARSTSFASVEDRVSLEIGTTVANAWGLFDMIGNVEEWVSDWYGPYRAESQTDPVGPADGSFKISRGGSHGTDPYYLRSANRMASLPQTSSWLIGFRVVQGRSPKTKPFPVSSPESGANSSSPSPQSKAMDPQKPFFLGPRRYVKIPPEARGPLFPHHNHDAAITDCPNGDLLAIWYTCGQERGRELAVAAARLPRGSGEWEPAFPFWDTPDRNDHCPALWFDGKQTLYHFNGVSAAGRWEPLAILMRTSIDNGYTWSRARLIAPDFGLRNMVGEPVLQTADGSILFGADAGGGSTVWISRDHAKTWSDPGGTIRGVHAGIVELKDGRLLALGRGQNIDGWMPASYSSDRGATWVSQASPFPPIGGGQRAALLRLKEGAIFFASFAKNIRDFEPATETANDERGQTNLFAALSFDEGKSWPVRKVISDGLPEHGAATTDGALILMSPDRSEPQGYLSVCQAKDGRIHLISSWNHYAFNVAWLKQETGTPKPGPEFRNLSARESLTQAFRKSPSVLEDLSPERGFTLECLGGAGLELSLEIRTGPHNTNRYRLRVATDGIYYRQTGKEYRIAGSAPNPKGNRYRLAIRNDTALQIYRDGVFLSVQPADVLIDWRLPARGSVLSWKNAVQNPLGDNSGAYAPVP